MRLNMTQQGGLVDEFVSGGGSVLTPLILTGNPNSPLEAATKQYVDTSLLSLNVNNVIGGTISSNRFPAMNGDLFSSSGSGNLVLSNTSVTPGTYAKVSVDDKGRVTNGMSLIESDIPGFSWNKVTSDKSSTLSGYGITDALPATGGTMTGQLSISGTPTLANQLVNKNYLDSVVGGTTGITVGDIIAKLDTTTPTGFLKCNGAELDKTTYSDLYNVIGDSYVINGKAGNGQPWRNQYNINTENFGDLSNWKPIASLPGVLGGAVTFVTKNRIYVYGGFNGSSHVGTGYTAQINNDGTLGSWSAAATLPGVYAYSSSIVTKNKVYLLGGYINNTTATNITYVADINADGTLGTWGNGPTMPGVTAYNTSFINKNKIYVIGGYNGSTGISSVFSNEIKDDGTLGTWVTETPLPVTVHVSPVTIVKNRVYIIGGQLNNLYSANIYSAALNSDGTIGTWQLSGTAPVTLGVHQIATTKNVIYIIGGVQNSAHSANIYKANILPDGSIGSWQLQSWTLPATLAYSNITITKDHVHVIGGMIAGGWSGVCWTADITSGLNDYSSFYMIDEQQNYMMPGSGKPWQQQYQINNTQSADITGWVTDSSVLPQALSAAQVIVTKNRVYLLGGHNGTTAVSNVYSALINSDGTLGTWELVGTSFNGNLTGSGSVVIPNGVTDITVISKGSNGSTTYSWSTGNGAVPVNERNLPNPPPGSINYFVSDEWGGQSGTTLPRTSYDTAASVLTYGYQFSWYVEYSRNTSVVNGVSSTFTIDGNTYTAVGGSGIPSTQQTFNITLPGTSSITGSYNIPVGGTCNLTYSLGNPLPGNLYFSQVIVTKNRAYMLGGNNGTTAVSVVYTAAINSDGTLGNWTTGTALPGALSHSQAIITKNRVYLLGGSNGTSIIPTVYTAPINVDGTLGNWTTGTALPGALSNSQAIITKNRVYLLGGSNSGGHVATIYTAFINSDGTLSTWVSNGTLPSVLVYSQAITVKNRVYLLGGQNSSGTYVSTVFTSPINTDGTLGAWTTGTSIPGPLAVSQAIVTSNHIYLLGGNNSSITSNIYSVTILEGENDYTSYYDGSVVPLEPINASTLFKLPDASFSNDNLNYFIKY